MDKLTLVFPDETMEQKALAYRSEHFMAGEKVINGSALLDKAEDYKAWLSMVRSNRKKETVSQDWVQASAFFAVRERDDEIVGIIDFRHYLNDFLKDYGHIGYSVRPSERRKGYATEMLRQALLYAKELGLREVQLSCYRDNIGSRKTILKNGGESVRFFDYDGREAEVFRIRIS